jgi:hypothetical protein
MKLLVKFFIGFITGIVLLMVFILVFSFEARIFLLMNLYRDESCLRISSSTNWIECNGFYDQKDGYLWLRFRSTSLPFHKITVKISDVNREEGIFLDRWAWSWSPKGDMLMIPLRPSVDSNNHYNLCIITLLKRDYKVSCYPEQKTNHYGQGGWSIDGNGFMYCENMNSSSSICHEINKDGLEIGIYEINLLSVFKGGNPYPYHLTWDNNNFFCDNGNSIIKISKTDLQHPRILLNINGPDSDLILLQLNPNKQQLLIYEGTYLDDYTVDMRFYLINSQDGGYISEIFRSTYKVSRIGESECLLSCSKMAIPIFSKDNRSLLIWSWDLQSIQKYDNLSSLNILSTDNNHHGFLMLWKGFTFTDIPGVRLYK